MISPAVHQPPPAELVEAVRYPAMPERIIRATMHLVAIVTMALASVLMVLALSTLMDIGNRLDDPAVTGCPLGGEDCGR